MYFITLTVYTTFFRYYYNKDYKGQIYLNGFPKP